MQIFKELNKLGYIHYSATTIEELDDLPLNSAERISEQALVLRWFREKYNLYSQTPSTCIEENVRIFYNNPIYDELDNIVFDSMEQYNTYEKAELECLKKLIKIVQNNEKGRVQTNNNNT